MSNQISVHVEVYDTVSETTIVRSSVTKTVMPANASDDKTDMYILLEEGVRNVAKDVSDDAYEQLVQMQRLSTEPVDA